VNSGLPPDGSGLGRNMEIVRARTGVSGPLKTLFIFNFQRTIGSRLESGRHLLVTNTLAECAARVYWPLVQYKDCQPFYFLRPAAGA
jgi:hypothetical protein